jgi:long-chain acyl-CoA synthetase
LKDFYSTFRTYVEDELIESKHAVFFEDKVSTYGDLLAEADKVAASLTHYGIKQGDGVAIYMKNSTQVLAIFLGIVKCGAIVMPMNSILTEYEIKPEFEMAKPKCVFISPDKLDTINRIKNTLPALEQVIVMNDSVTEGYITYKEFTSSGAKTQIPALEIDADDVALILFTTGTTGKPKGVMLTHRNLLSVVIGQRNRYGHLGEKVTICPVPLSHIFGLNTVTFASLFRKWPVVLQGQYELHQTAKLIEKYRVSYLATVPLIVKSMTEVADKYDLSSLKIIGAGAAPVPAELYDRVEKTFNLIMLEGWGLTEGAGNATRTPYGVKKVGSCGKAYEGIDIEVAIVDPQDNFLPPGKIGELVLKGSLVMKGYLNNPEATAEVIKDGWLHTGDVAKMDEEGYVYIVDRMKDVIIRGGYNIFPAEVEAAIYQYEGVEEVAVYGVKDAKKGETVAATVKIKDGYSVTPDDIIAHCSERLARYKVPKYAEITHDQLPKTSNNKILRRVLKDNMEAKLSGQKG